MPKNNLLLFLSFCIVLISTSCQKAVPEDEIPPIGNPVTEPSGLAYPITLFFKGLDHNFGFTALQRIDGSTITPISLAETTLDDHIIFTEIEHTGSWNEITFVSDQEAHIKATNNRGYEYNFKADFSYDQENNTLTFMVPQPGNVMDTVSATGSPEGFTFTSQAYVFEHGNGTISERQYYQHSETKLKENLREMGATLVYSNYEEVYGD